MITRIAHDIWTLFAGNNIPTEGVTIIINVIDKDAAAKVDFYIKKELENIGKITDIRNFELHGIKFKLESPLHEVEL